VFGGEVTSLGGELVGGETSWWRDDRIPFNVVIFGRTSRKYLCMRSQGKKTYILTQKCKNEPPFATTMQACYTYLFLDKLLPGI